MIYKVISDNGYKIELIRPLKDHPIQVGKVVELTQTNKVSDLVKLFDGIIDEDTLNAIFDKFNESKNAKV